jgi:hypothetical protein
MIAFAIDEPTCSLTLLANFASQRSFEPTAEIGLDCPAYLTIPTLPSFGDLTPRGALDDCNSCSRLVSSRREAAVWRYRRSGRGPIDVPRSATAATVVTLDR